MEKRTLLVAVLGVITGAMLGTTATVYSQSRASSLADFAQQKQDVSKMQWALLNARVQALEWTLIQDLSRPVSPANFTYDEKSKRIIAAAFVNPTWLAQTNLEKVRQVFSARAVDLCALGAGGALMQAGSPAGLNWKDNCSVRFYTWATDKANDSSAKDVALFEDGQLVLN